MRIWLDVHLPPILIPWIKEKFVIDCEAFRNAGLTCAADTDIFSKLRIKGEVVMTKDSDFVGLVEPNDPPTTSDMDYVW